MQLTVQRLVNHLAAREPPVTITKSTALKIMREGLGLRFNHFKVGRDRYTDQLFDVKRQVVSRILAQLFLDEVLIVAVEESSFNDQLAHRKRWQPGSQGIRLISEKSKKLFADAQLVDHEEQRQEEIPAKEAEAPLDQDSSDESVNSDESQVQSEIESDYQISNMRGPFVVPNIRYYSKRRGAREQAMQ